MAVFGGLLWPAMHVGGAQGSRIAMSKCYGALDDGSNEFFKRSINLKLMVKARCGGESPLGFMIGCASLGGTVFVWEEIR